MGGGRVEEDDGTIGETGAFAEGGWCWSGLVVKGMGARALEERTICGDEGKEEEEGEELW